MSNPLKHFQRAAEIRGAYRRVFESEDGKIILAHLAKYTGVTQNKFHPDHRIAAFHEGMRAVWIQIVKLLASDERQFQKRIQDIINEQAEQITHE